MFRQATVWQILGLLFWATSPVLARTSSMGEILTSQPVETLLLVCGGIFLILSVLTMGSGIAEGLCLASFTTLFVGRYLQGEDPWIPLGLLVVGVLCLLAEVFVLPGFGICGILGLLAIGAMTVTVAGSTSAGLTIFFLTTICSVVAGFVAIRLLPSTRFTSKLFILQPPEPTSAALPTAPSYLPSLGDRGVAATSLRPGGYATFDNERVDVTAENEFVPKGQALEVLRIEGSKVVVRSVR